MLKILFDFLFYTLAIYGALSIMISLAGLTFRKTMPGDGKVRMILLVKDAEEVIEGIIRNIFLGGVLARLMCNGGLTVVDMGSSDRTTDILDRLKREYDSMEIVSQRDKEKVLTVFSEK